MNYTSILLTISLVSLSFCKAKNKSESKVQANEANDLDQQFIDDFNAYEPDFYDGKKVDWDKAKKFLELPSGISNRDFQHAPVPAVDGNEYTVQDLLFSDWAHTNHQYPREYLSSINESFNNLIELDKNADINSPIAIDGGLIIETRDKAVEGLSEFNETGVTAPDGSFDDFWGPKLESSNYSRWGIKFNHQYVQYYPDEYMLWLEEYKYWIDFDSVIMANIVLYDSYMISQDVYVAIKEKAETLSKLGEQSPYLFEIADLKPGGESPTLAIRAGEKLIKGANLEEFHTRHDTLVKSIFKDVKFNETESTFERALRLEKALNVYNYFHLQPNGMGRVYMSIRNFEALRLKIPLKMYHADPRYVDTNKLSNVRRTFLANKKNNSLWQQLVTIIETCPNAFLR